ncbi:hypothetical protein J31TS4_34350 [Paenibacillus sp. J31TS4]|nr:hypothetical protein J31TS4_34350 [Paenibacillus sp. J31TS4]
MLGASSLGAKSTGSGQRGGLAPARHPKSGFPAQTAQKGQPQSCGWPFWQASVRSPFRWKGRRLPPVRYSSSRRSCSGDLWLK